MSLRILLGNQVENLWHLQLEPGLPLRTMKSTELKYIIVSILFVLFEISWLHLLTHTYKMYPQQHLGERLIE